MWKQCQQLDIPNQKVKVISSDIASKHHQHIERPKARPQTHSSTAQASAIHLFHASNLGFDVVMLILDRVFVVICLSFSCFSILRDAPLLSSSQHQVSFYMFSRESLSALSIFLSHCLWDREHPHVYCSLSSKVLLWYLVCLSQRFDFIACENQGLSCLSLIYVNLCACIWYINLKDPMRCWCFM